jgi:hypothetical protein
MKVKLRATHVSDTPTAELARRAKGRFFAVEGVVDFSPEPGGGVFGEWCAFQIGFIGMD